MKLRLSQTKIFRNPESGCPKFVEVVLSDLIQDDQSILHIVNFTIGQE